MWRQLVFASKGKQKATIFFYYQQLLTFFPPRADCGCAVQGRLPLRWRLEDRLRMLPESLHPRRPATVTCWIQAGVARHLPRRRPLDDWLQVQPAEGPVPRRYPWCSDDNPLRAIRLALGGRPRQPVRP